MFKNGLFSLVQFYIWDNLKTGDEVLGTSFQHFALTQDVAMDTLNRIVPYIQDARAEYNATQETKRLIGLGLIENNTRTIIRQEFAQIEKRCLTVDVLYAHQLKVANVHLCETILKINRHVILKDECTLERVTELALETHELHIKDPFLCGQYSGVIVRDSDQIHKGNEGRIFHRFLV